MKNSPRWTRDGAPTESLRPAMKNAGSPDDHLGEHLASLAVMETAVPGIPVDVDTPANVFFRIGKIAMRTRSRSLAPRKARTQGQHGKEGMVDRHRPPFNKAAGSRRPVRAADQKAIRTPNTAVMPKPTMRRSTISGRHRQVPSRSACKAIRVSWNGDMISRREMADDFPEMTEGYDPAAIARSAARFRAAWSDRRRTPAARTSDSLRHRSTMALL